MRYTLQIQFWVAPSRIVTYSVEEAIARIEENEVPPASKTSLIGEFYESCSPRHTCEMPETWGSPVRGEFRSRR